MIIAFLFSLALANDTIILDNQEPVFSAEETRCKLQTNDNRFIIHQFKWYSWELDKMCEYGIKVDNEVIISSKAFIDECKEFMQIQEKKGSVCLVNTF